MKRRSICRLLLVLAAALALAAPAQARRHHPRHPHAARPLPQATLTTAAGAPLGGVLQRWIKESKVASGAYKLTIDPSLDCGAALGCSQGPEIIQSQYVVVGSGLPAHAAGPWMSVPFSTNIKLGQPATRETLYFELGHQFDWHFLTAHDRLWLARAMGLPHRQWWDTLAGLDRGAEDGLEGAFAGIYADCAEGWNDMGGSITTDLPGSPQANIHADICGYINRLATPAAARTP